jgi:ATP-dependent protease HslVU (ClpYQ) peptidase subunit
MQHSTLSPEQIALEAMKIAASKCIYTSDQFILEKIE